MAELLLHIPFQNDLIDTSPYHWPVERQGGSFAAGRTGNALYFEGEGRVEVLHPVVPLAEDFTLTLWAKALPGPQGPTTALWLLLRFVDSGGKSQYRYVDLATDGFRWTFLALQQAGTSLTLLVNSRPIARETYPVGWGKPTGFCIVSDNPHSGGGYAAFDEFSLYRGIASLDITNLTPQHMLVQYTINNVPFTRYGVYVSDSDGLLDNLTRKEPLTANWSDSHGEVVDLSRPRYAPREITLSCFLEAAGPDEFIDRVRGFLSLFDQPGTGRLMLELGGEKPLVYEVYLAGQISLKKRWNAGRMIGTFTLNLREPQPVKRVLKFAGSGMVSVTLSCATSLDIYWGDGQVARDVSGTNRTLSHSYALAGDHYLIVAGVLSDITHFATTAQIVWNQL